MSSIYECNPQLMVKMEELDPELGTIIKTETLDLVPENIPVLHELRGEQEPSVETEALDPELENNCLFHDLVLGRVTRIKAETQDPVPENMSLFEERAEPIMQTEPLPPESENINLVEGQYPVLRARTKTEAALDPMQEYLSIARELDPEPERGIKTETLFVVPENKFTGHALHLEKEPIGKLSILETEELDPELENNCLFLGLDIEPVTKIKIDTTDPVPENMSLVEERAETEPLPPESENISLVKGLCRYRESGGNRVKMESALLDPMLALEPVPENMILVRVPDTGIKAETLDAGSENICLDLGKQDLDMKINDVAKGIDLAKSFVPAKNNEPNIVASDMAEGWMMQGGIMKEEISIEEESLVMLVDCVSSVGGEMLLQRLAPAHAQSDNDEVHVSSADYNGPPISEMIFQDHETESPAEGQLFSDYVAPDPAQLTTQPSFLGNRWRRRRHSCSQCPGSFADGRSLALHMKTHSRGDLACRTCGKSFLCLSSLRTRRVVRVNRKTYHFCALCTRQFAQLDRLKVHMETHRMSGKKFSCSDCDESVPIRDNLRGHRIGFYNRNGERFSCQLCPKFFLKALALKHHLKAHLPVVQIKKESSCSKCGQSVASLEELGRHMKVHWQEERLFSSTNCFKSLSYVKAHLSAVKSKKNNSCLVCARPFPNKEDLAKHMNEHWKDREKLCLTARDLESHLLKEKDCYKAFLNKRSLGDHKSPVHFKTKETTTELFTCYKCGATRATLGNLKKHMRAHSDRKNRYFKCPWCFLTFSQASGLNDHIIVHMRK